MTDTLTFPGLGWEFTINRVAFSIGDFSIYWYGILFAVAFLAGITYFHFRARETGIHPYDGLDVLLWAIVGGLIGARAYFVIFQWDMYKDNLMKIFAVREGGIAMYGGVIGAILVGWIACRVKKLPLRPMLDASLPGLLLAQAIGRWGNFFNMEAFGVNTDLPWGMTSQTIQNYLTNMQSTLAAQGITVDPSLPVHPTFFYESVLDLAGFLVLAFLIAPRRKYDGQVALWYMAWYGICRAMVESLRTDSLMWGSFRVSQVLGLTLFVLSVLLLNFFQSKVKKDPKPGYLVMYAESEESIRRIAAVEREMKEGKAKKGAKAADGGEDPEKAGAEPQDVPEDSCEEAAAPAGTEEQAPAEAKACAAAEADGERAAEEAAAPGVTEGPQTQEALGGPAEEAQNEEEKKEE